MKFKSNIEIQAGLEDASGSPGTVNQLLSSTATGTAWIDPSTIVAEAATLVVIACKNTSGATIAQGTPVYQTGTVGATATIEIAPADALISANKLPAIGLLQTALNNNGFGFVVITGELTNFTTSPIDGVVPTTGDKIFVKSGGGLTLTKPTGEGNGIQNMGLVGKVSTGNSGSITVSSIMRTNDVPNLPEGRIWVGDGNTIVSDTVYVDEPNLRLGIGTDSPGTKLQVGTGSGATVDTAYQIVADGSAISGIQILSGTNHSGRLVFGDSDNNDIGIIKYDHSDNSLQTIVNASEKTRVTSAGILMVGGTTGGYSGTKIHVGNFTDTQNGINILSSTTGYGYLLFGDGTGADTYRGQITYYHGDDSMLFNTNGSEKLRIVSGGGISFAGATNFGSAGQVLKSNGSASPAWVDASTVIGGPYLPLAGGTMTGTITMSNNRITSIEELRFNNGGNIDNQINTDVDTGTETVANVAIATYTAAFFDFVIKKTTNVRSGTVYACHDGTNVEFTETSTNDLGDTSDVTLSVDISGTNMRLLATVTSDDWSVKSLIRAI